MDYNDITWFENKKRLEILIEFKQLLTKYHQNIRYADIGIYVIENRAASRTREIINKKIDCINKAIEGAGLNTVLIFSGYGMNGPIDLLQNIFNLHQYNIQIINLVDIINRSIGIYERNKLRSKIRTINPFHWIAKIIDKLATLPFIAIEKFGFNRTKAESSAIGRIIKLIIWLATVFSSIIVTIAAGLTILDKIGYLDYLKTKIGINH